MTNLELTDEELAYITVSIGRVSNPLNVDLYSRLSTLVGGKPLAVVKANEFQRKMEHSS